MIKMALVKLKKSQYAMFLDVAKDLTFAASEWKRICKSTIFELAINPQSESREWIDSDTPEEEVTSNQPEMAQECSLYEGDPLFDFLQDMMISLPTGEDVKVPYMLCFGGSKKQAWRGVATILFDTLNSVDGKITFTVKFNTVNQGTYDVAEGVPTFTAEEEDVQG
jgi:hypothetical protein